MTLNLFEHILTLVALLTEKRTTRFRERISASQRLTLQLHFLATGESQQSLDFSYRIGKATVSKTVSETSLAIYNSLKQPYLKPPSLLLLLFNLFKVGQIYNSANIFTIQYIITNQNRLTKIIN